MVQPCSFCWLESACLQSCIRSTKVRVSVHFDARHHGGEVVHHQDAEVHEEQAAAEETICEALSFAYCGVARSMAAMPRQWTQKLLTYVAQASGGC